MSMEKNELNLVKDKGFAIIQLPPGSEIKLLRILMENGYTNVSFTNGNGETIGTEKNEKEMILDEEEDEGEEDVDVESVEVEEENKADMMEREQEEEKSSESFDEPEYFTPSHKEPAFSSLALPTILVPAPNPGALPFYNPFLPSTFLPSFPPPIPTTNPNLNIPYFQHQLGRIQHRQELSQSQMPDTPPTTPRGSNSNESGCLINGAKLRQRGRQLRRSDRDTSSYASCRLCRNRILANRLSNLHNHVRRHAVMKQFHCCYCSYAHTEVAKVRLHMLHNHKDDRSQPLDKRNEDMEAAWSLLMKKCFPGFA